MKGGQATLPLRQRVVRTVQLVRSRAATADRIHPTHDIATGIARDGSVHHLPESHKLIAG